MLLDFPEIVIICGVALVVLGPKKLPGAAAQIGRWGGRARAMARQFREQLELEVNSVESALDTNAARKPVIKPPTPASSPVAPETESSAVAPETESSAGYPESSAEDPVAFPQPRAGTDWYPEFPGFEGAPAPYGDPNAIPEPEPESSPEQLSLQLGPSPAAPAAAPRPPAVERSGSADTGTPAQGESR